jgi:hypothetical protein
LGDFLKEHLVRIRPPGEVSCYDTYAITLAGYLIEEISGLSYEQYLRENIFVPLEMYRSNIWVPKALKTDVSRGYEFRGQWEEQRWEFLHTNPASSVNSTVADMAHLIAMLTNKGSFKGRRILSASSVGEMLKRQYSNHPNLPGFGYTFWEDQRHGIKAFSHGGSMTGYGCILYLIPDKDLGVFISYNQESGRLATHVLTRLIEVMLPSLVKKVPLLEKAGPSEPVSHYTGTYADKMYNHSRPQKVGWLMRPFELTSNEKGELIFRDQIARPVERLVFQTDNGLILAFRENSAGQITHLLVNQTAYERLSQKDREDYLQRAAPDPIKLEPALLRRYAGQYSGNGGEIRVTAGRGSLSVLLLGRDTVEFVPYDKTNFYSKSAPAHLEFVIDLDGTVKQVILQVQGWNSTLTRASAP